MEFAGPSGETWTCTPVVKLLLLLLLPLPNPLGPWSPTWVLGILGTDRVGGGSKGAESPGGGSHNFHSSFLSESQSLIHTIVHLQHTSSYTPNYKTGKAM